MIEYTHVDPEITTVDEFLDQFGLSIVRGLDKQQFLSIKGADGLTNLDRIYNQYGKYDRLKFKDDYQAGTLTQLDIFTQLTFPAENAFVETLAITGSNQIQSVDPVAFICRQLKELLTSNLFRRVVDAEGAVSSQTIIQHPLFTVWIWSRALDELVDITPFVDEVSTNNDSNGGNFTIKITAITRVKKDRFPEYYNSLSSHLNLASADSSSTSPKTLDFISNSITANDVVFIRYEPLLLEKDRISNKFIRSNTEIPSSLNSPKVYDMIGLVDNIPTTTTYRNSDISVTITGRDLSKLLLDDSSYFYPLAFAQNVFINRKENEKLIKRLAVDGQFILQSKFAFRSIRFSIQYILNHLANLQIVPDDFFAAYGSRRTLVYRTGVEATVEPAGNTSARLRNEINFIVAAALSDKTEVEVGIAQNIVQSFAETLINNNAAYVDFAGYNQFVWNGEVVSPNKTPQALREQGLFLWKSVVAQTANQSTTQQVTPTQLLQLILDLAKANSQQQEVIYERPAYGIWQIVKLVIDEAVADRRIADPSIAQPDGSLMAQLQKICQQPFVELSTDTYGDLFYIIVRQPPHTRQAVTRWLNNEFTVEPESSFSQVPGDKSADAVQTIEGWEVDSEQIDFDNRVYSMYEITPQGLFIGQGSQVTLAYIPIVYFPQYADIWGAQKLSITSNYIPYSGISGYNASKTQNYIAAAAVSDLSYLIETNAYLPFTRKGTIRIYGRRTIKKGTWIRFQPTGEIFYVTGVSINSSISQRGINYTTTLTVERGMVEKFTKGEISYFNIINVELIGKAIEQHLSSSKPMGVEISNNFGVNQSVFDFFLQKRQFL